MALSTLIRRIGTFSNLSKINLVYNNLRTEYNDGTAQ